jgi:hypothetical protein
MLQFIEVGTVQHILTPKKIQFKNKSGSGKFLDDYSANIQWTLRETHQKMSFWQRFNRDNKGENEES